MAVAAILAQLEAISARRPDRVLRLRGFLPAPPGLAGAGEPFELLIFRGFSSLTTHPTAHDPDQPAIPEASAMDGAELLHAPLDPLAPPLAGPLPVERFLDPQAWG